MRLHLSYQFFDHDECVCLATLAHDFGTRIDLVTLMQLATTFYTMTVDTSAFQCRNSHWCGTRTKL